MKVSRKNAINWKPFIKPLYTNTPNANTSNPNTNGKTNILNVRRTDIIKEEAFV